MTRTEWIEALATALGIDPPSAEEVEEILELAGTAAHATERSAAPLATWLVGKSGRSLEEVNAVAAKIAPPQA